MITVEFILESLLVYFLNTVKTLNESRMMQIKFESSDKIKAFNNIKVLLLFISNYSEGNKFYLTNVYEHLVLIKLLIYLKIDSWLLL